MKQGIANIWLLGMIVVFIAMFSAYIITTINYSKTFKMKNEMLTIIEKHHGMTSNQGSSVSSIIPGKGDVIGNVGAIQTINLYLRGMSYSTLGRCPNADADMPGYWYGVTSLANDAELSDLAEHVTTNEKKYYWCFAKYDAQLSTGVYSSAYYKVRIFYGFDVPILSTFLSVRVDGFTDEIYDLYDVPRNVEGTTGGATAANTVISSDSMDISYEQLRR